VRNIFEDEDHMLNIVGDHGFFFKIWTMPQRLPLIGQWSIFFYKLILNGEISDYILYKKKNLEQIFFFSMKIV
jgi:hypothetical protein